MEKELKGILIIGTVRMTPVVIYLSKVCLPASFSMDPASRSTPTWLYTL